MKRHTYLVLVLLASCSSPEPSRVLPAGSTSAPDILLISIDTLRPDHLGTYGSDRDTSPYLDQKAREGVVFERAWSPAPWTLPAHASMLSARRPDHHGAIEDDLAIGRDVAMLPEALEALGYRRGGFVTTPFVGARYGFDRGFDHFEELFPEDFSLATALDADTVATRVLDWAERLPPGMPAFAFVHFYDAHYPCDPPPPWNTRFNRAARPEELEYENYFHYLQNPLSEARLEQERGQYDEEIAFVDSVLRELCTTWAASRPNTIFVVVSDHGEEFGERGSWGHGHTLTPEQLHVPWIMWGPGIEPGRVTTRVGLEDVAPTLATFAGTTFGPFDGFDRSPTLRDANGEPGEPGGLLASTSRRNTLAIRLHADPVDMIADLRNRQVALYDLDADPQATRNIATEQTELVMAMWGRLIQVVGLPWEAVEPVKLETDGVIITADGNLSTGEIVLPEGARFALWPLDAEMRHAFGSEVWRAFGGGLPGPKARLRYNADPVQVESAPLTEEERERLRALGYAN
jgi:arylsulfatase A-like enzyme